MKTSKKILFLKSDKIGKGELGSMLVKGLFSAMLEQGEMPKAIICVNSAVLLTTSNEDDEITQILKSIEQKGVKIYSCGTCLDFYGIREKLIIGEAGNAVDTAKMLLTEDITSL